MCRFISVAVQLASIYSAEPLQQKCECEHAGQNAGSSKPSGAARERCGIFAGTGLRIDTKARHGEELKVYHGNTLRPIRSAFDVMFQTYARHCARSQPHLFPNLNDSPVNPCPLERSLVCR